MTIPFIFHSTCPDDVLNALNIFQEEFRAFECFTNLFLIVFSFRAIMIRSALFSEILWTVTEMQRTSGCKTLNLKQNVLKETWTKKIFALE